MIILRYVVLCLTLVWPQLTADTSRAFVNSKFHYALKVPGGWNAEGQDIPVLFNYRASEGGPQGLFPDHGAQITLIPLAAVQAVVDAGTMDEWIKRNLASNHTNVSIRHLPAPEDNRALTPRDIVEVEADFERDPQDDMLQHEVDYYFYLRGAPFRLRLLYWKDDKQSSGHRAALQYVLRSITAAP